jgi:hypothetical protein
MEGGGEEEREGGGGGMLHLVVGAWELNLLFLGLGRGVSRLLGWTWLSLEFAKVSCVNSRGVEFGMDWGLTFADISRPAPFETTATLAVAVCHMAQASDS